MTTQTIYTIVLSVLLLYMTIRVYVLRQLIKEVIVHLDQAPINYSNGVIKQGQDEGEYQGWMAHNELVVKLTREVIEVLF